MKASSILIVEDEFVIAKDIETSLGNMGYIVCAIVPSGEEAIAKAEKEKPDLVLMDIILKGAIDGIEAARQIWSQLNIPIVYLTAYADENTLERAKITEPYGYIIKPFNDRELNTAIEIALYKYKMEKKLKESEERFKFLTENMADIVWTLDRDFKTTYVSPSIEKVLGFTAEERKLQTLEEMVTPESVQKAKTMFLEKLQRDEEDTVDPDRAVTAEVEYYHKDGSTVWMENRLKALRDQTGAIIGMYGASRDITERKRAEVSLRESEEALRHAAEEWRQSFDAIEGMMILTDTDFNVQRVNKATARILGRDITKIPGQPCYRLFHGTETPPDSCPKLKAMITGKPEYAEMQEPHLGRILGISVSPVKDDQGRVVRTVEVIDDITIRKQNEQEAIRLTEALANSFMSTTEAISDLTEKRDLYTAGHSKGVTELAVSIAQKMGMEEEEIQGLHVCAMLHDMGKVVIPTGILNKPGRLSEHEFAIIKLHPTTAYETLHHIPFPWPVAEVVLQHHERMDGTGYPQGLKGDDIHPWARILAVADVVDSMATHRPYRAALSQQIVLKELNRGHGTVYDRQVVDTYKAILSEKTNRVLVVDDDPGTLGFLINQLNQMNMQVEGFNDPYKALEAFKEQPFPVVITDLNMPNMSGLELTEKMKKIHPASKVIMVTGFGGKKNIMEALRAGVFDLLEKPVHIDLLSAVVNKAIRIYQGEE